MWFVMNRIRVVTRVQSRPFPGMGLFLFSKKGRTSMRPKGTSRREPPAGGAKHPAAGVSLRRTSMRSEGASRREPLAGKAKHPATTRLAVRPCGVHAGNSRKMAATTHINPRPQAAQLFPQRQPIPGVQRAERLWGPPWQGGFRGIETLFVDGPQSNQRKGR